MFGLSRLWLVPLGAVAFVAAIAWHQKQVEDMRSEILDSERQRVAFATERLQTEEAQRQAAIAAESAREEAELTEALAHKELAIAQANERIAELEKANTKCGTVSEGTVRQLNSSSSPGAPLVPRSKRLPSRQR